MPGPLYVCDLDGTLLRPDGRLSDVTRDIVNRLLAEGVRITVATARSLVSVRRVAGDLHLTEPLVVYGGAFVVDPATGENLVEHVLSAGTVDRILSVCGRLGFQPLVYALAAEAGGPVSEQTRASAPAPCFAPALAPGVTPGRAPIAAGIEGDTVSWVTGDESFGIRWYLGDRRGDPRLRPVSTAGELPRAGVFSLAVLAPEPELVDAARILLDELSGEITVTLQAETYEETLFWLEIGSPASTKGHGVDALREIAGAETITCFGDNRNDLAMFAVADEAYAVANALPEVRAAATAVIGSNADDGVAHWLAEHAVRADRPVA